MKRSYLILGYDDRPSGLSGNPVSLLDASDDAMTKHAVIELSGLMRHGIDDIIDADLCSKDRVFGWIAGCVEELP